MTREPPNRYSPPCVLRVAGGRPPVPRAGAGWSRRTGTPAVSGRRSPNLPCPGSSRVSPTPLSPTHTPHPQTVLPPPGVSSWGHVAPTSAGGGSEWGSHFHPHFLERLEGEWGESSDRCLARGGRSGCNRCAQSAVGALGGGPPPTTGVLGVVLTLIAPPPERGQLRVQLSRKREQGALWAPGHAGSFAQWAGHAGNYLLRGVYSLGWGAV